ncbi:MAG: hypothetical protein Q7S38_01415 [bacterium]|nr:hypothetical protein [bacterium]
MNSIIIIILVLIIVGLAVGVYQRSNKENILKGLKPGSLLLTTGYVKGKESKAKILAIDERNGDKIYSLKIYPQENPENIITKDGKQVDVSGIEHIPLSEATLKKWNFKVIGFEAVKDTELVGYKIWKNDSSAGSF